MKNFNITLIFLLVANIIFAQKKIENKLSLKEFKKTNFIYKPINFSLTSPKKKFSQPINIINNPKSFYYNGLGFMCKQEYKFIKITKIPLHFRIGSLAQCNYLEGKKNADILTIK